MTPSMRDKVWELVLEYVDERYDPCQADHTTDLQDIVDSIQELASKVEDDCDDRAEYERDRKKGEGL
jgi:hypothetical protein